MFARIIFLDGDEGRRVVDALTHTHNVVMHGASAASVEAVVDYLAQWDYGEYDDTHAESAAGRMDEQVQVDGYLLSWNAGLGYVGLEAVMDAISGRPIEVSTCRGCNQPIDYCTDHTHAPDTESEEWETDYAAVTAAITSEED